MKGFRNLIVWQKSHQLALSIYEITKSFPSEEKFGLISQIRRACLSIPTNIAEGTGRKSEKETIQFFSIALGSANEVDYLIEFSKDLNLLDKSQNETLSEKIEEVKSMLFVLIKNKTLSLKT